jgi:probable rRNA maturation factor
MAVLNIPKEIMEIAVKNLQSSIPISVSKIYSAAQKIGKILSVKKGSKSFPKIVSIAFVGTRRMLSINKKYLSHDYVTDVITFDLEDSAEIIICPQVAHQNSKIHNVSVNKEILLYMVHGFLHLAGYDDKSPLDIQRIRLKEKQLLKQLV